MILRDIVLQRLQGKLWHTTHPDRFNAILAKGAILPEAEISDSERWGTAAGQEHILMSVFSVVLAFSTSMTLIRANMKSAVQHPHGHILFPVISHGTARFGLKSTAPKL